MRATAENDFRPSLVADPTQLNDVCCPPHYPRNETRFLSLRPVKILSLAKLRMFSNDNKHRRESCFLKTFDLQEIKDCLEICKWVFFIGGICLLPAVVHDQ